MLSLNDPTQFSHFISIWMWVLMSVCEHFSSAFTHCLHCEIGRMDGPKLFVFKWFIINILLMQVLNLSTVIKFSVCYVCVCVFANRVGAKYFYAQYLIGYDDYTKWLKITHSSLWRRMNSWTLVSVHPNHPKVRRLWFFFCFWRVRVCYNFNFILFRSKFWISRGKSDPERNLNYIYDVAHTTLYRMLWMTLPFLFFWPLYCSLSLKSL